jgi:hypothetical protein
MEPALSLLVEGMAELDSKNRRAYGHDIPLRETVDREAGTALVTGCLDSSAAGVADARTGQKLTVGVPTNPVFVTLKRDRDQIWRVFGTMFPGGTKC